MKTYEMEKIVESMNYLKSLNPLSFDELKELLTIYDKDEDYCDFYYDIPETDFVLEGSFYKNENGEICNANNYTLLDNEKNTIMEIE